MNLLNLNLTETQTLLEQMGEKPFRARQILSWLNKEIPFEEMHNLGADLIKKLRENHTEGHAKEVKCLTSTDGTKKFLLQFDDGQVIESVLMQRNYGNTLCVSTQVGCKMGCVFCASCKAGLVRNLSSGEILAQVIHANKIAPISNIVLMGIGEPLDNYDNVIKFLKCVNAKEGLNIGMRGISISTCGLPTQIEKLAKEDMQITLSISLHASTNAKREQIMPIAKMHSIEEILKSAKNYFEKTKRRIIIEYILIDEFNDTKVDAHNLKTLLGNLNCLVNLIPLNETGALKPTPKAKQYAFLKYLEDLGLNATIRKSSGKDILGACGQLRQNEV